MTGFAHDAVLEQLYEEYGAAATLTNPGAAVEQHQVLVREMPNDRAQMRHGQDDVRMAEVEFRRAALAADPVKDAVLVIADGAQAGTWFCLGIERSGDDVVVIRVRRSARANAAAPGAREVRR